MSSKLEQLQSILSAIGILGFSLGGPVVLALTASHLSYAESGAPWWAWVILATSAILYFAFLGFLTNDTLSVKEKASGILIIIIGMLCILFSLVAGVYSLYVLFSEGISSPWWAWGGYLLLCIALSAMALLAGNNAVESTIALVLIVIPLTLGISLFIDDLNFTTIALGMLGPTVATALLIAMGAVLPSKP